MGVVGGGGCNVTNSVHEPQQFLQTEMSQRRIEMRQRGPSVYEFRWAKQALTLREVRCRLCLYTLCLSLRRSASIALCGCDWSNVGYDVIRKLLVDLFLPTASSACVLIELVKRKTFRGEVLCMLQRALIVARVGNGAILESTETVPLQR